MVRVLRGIGVGVLGFFLFIIAGMVAIANTTGFGGDQDFDLNYAMQEVPIWTILTILGVILFIGGPLYYWILEPILKKRSEMPKY